MLSENIRLNNNIETSITWLIPVLNCKYYCFRYKLNMDCIWGAYLRKEDSRGEFKKALGLQGIIWSEDTITVWTNVEAGIKL